MMKVSSDEDIKSDNGLDVLPKAYEESTNVDTVKKLAAPGKRWQKVKKSRSYVDAKGYFVTEDYSSEEEVDDLPKKRALEP
jgi:hypothetical protein